MNHPEILLIPVVMLLDYYLTIVGEIFRKKGHEKHFKIESYELNPSFQSEVKNTQWISPKFLLRVVFITIILIPLGFVAEPEHDVDLVIDLIMGFFLVSWGMIIGRHISNIIIFRSIAQKPQQISGEVTMDQGFTLASSMVQYFPVWLLLVIILLFSPSEFLAGGVLGATWLIGIHYFWMRKLHKTKANALK